MQVATADAGAKVRAQYISEAESSKAKWAQRKAALDKEVDQRRQEKEAADGEFVWVGRVGGCCRMAVWVGGRGNMCEWEWEARCWRQSARVSRCLF